jgi:Holliday junction resolvase RusA-like endonuclease
MIEFTVYGIPCAKGRARHTRAGITFTPAKTRNEESNFRAQAINSHKPNKPLNGSILLEVCFYMPIPSSASKKLKQAMQDGCERPTKKPDLDNLVKLVKDALNGVYWQDDKQVISLKAEKFYSEQPRTEVRIIEMG